MFKQKQSYRNKLYKAIYTNMITSILKSERTLALHKVVITSHADS